MTYDVNLECGPSFLLYKYLSPDKLYYAIPFCAPRTKKVRLYRPFGHQLSFSFFLYILDSMQHMLGILSTIGTDISIYEEVKAYRCVV